MIDASGCETTRRDELLPQAVVAAREKSFYLAPLPEVISLISTIDCPVVRPRLLAYLAIEDGQTQPSHHSDAFRARLLVAELDAEFPIVKVPVTPDPDPVTAADPAGHDQYFQIERISGSIQAAAVRCLADAKQRYHETVMTSYSPDDRHLYAGISTGLLAALSHLAGQTPPRITAADRPAFGRSTQDPAERWVLGHQIFAAITQGIILAMTAFERELIAGDVASAGRALDLAATLLLASASAFRFTADFSPVAYSDVVRPSMGPEHVGRGFSGLLSHDHRVLVDTMMRTRPLMGEAATALPAEHGRVRAALNYVYDDHKFVCARFGGGEGSSLRSDACSEVPGVVLLDRFKKARTRLLVPMAKTR